MYSVDRYEGYHCCYRSPYRFDRNVFDRPVAIANDVSRLDMLRRLKGFVDRTVDNYTIGVDVNRLLGLAFVIRGFRPELAVRFVLYTVY